MLWLSVGSATPAQAACGETGAVTPQELLAEEQALRQTEQTVRTSRSRLQAAEAELRTLLAHPPADFDPVLAQQLAALRRTEVEPKRQILEHLRVQHEEARRQWERGHQLLAPQLAQARAAWHAKTITTDVYCRTRAAYEYALRLYVHGIQRYRQGLMLYAQALDLYVEQFVTPYLQGFTDRQQWQHLIARLQARDFLHEVLVPMTANAVRSLPPESPPG